MLNTKEHDDIMEAFERTNPGRVDREDRSIWTIGRIYQSGEVNNLFIAYRRGYALGKSVAADDNGDNSSLMALYHAVGELIDRDNCNHSQPPGMTRNDRMNRVKRAHAEAAGVMGESERGMKGEWGKL